MLTGIVLLYVGAALLVNGIWLIGQARVADRPALEPIPEMTDELLEREPLISAGSSQATVRERRSAPSNLSDRETHFSFLQGREITVINIFTGGVGVVVATLLIILGGIHNSRSDIANAAFILLFAFTYLWIAANQFLNAGNRAFGWFCFFIAVTAVPTGIYTLRDAHGNAASVWLGINWFAWAVLWFLFFLMLTLNWSIARPVGWATITIAVGTAWAFGYAILQGAVAF
jgi:hypothetical protein